LSNIECIINFLVSCQKAEISFDVLGAKDITFPEGKVLTLNKETNSGYDYEVGKLNAFKCITDKHLTKINLFFDREQMALKPAFLLGVFSAAPARRPQHPSTTTLQTSYSK
jgi:hypothetical protein